MADSLDSVERIEPHTTTQRVRRSHQSTEEKDRKFASALKDKMEEESRRKRKQKDEVILVDSAESTAEEERAEEPEAATESEHRQASEPGGETSSHIDVKA